MNKVMHVLLQASVTSSVTIGGGLVKKVAETPV